MRFGVERTDGDIEALADAAMRALKKMLILSSFVKTFYYLANRIAYKFLMALLFTTIFRSKLVILRAKVLVHLYVE